MTKFLMDLMGLGGRAQVFQALIALGIAGFLIWRKSWWTVAFGLVFLLAMWQAWAFSSGNVPETLIHVAAITSLVLAAVGLALFFWGLYKHKPLWAFAALFAFALNIASVAAAIQWTPIFGNSHFWENTERWGNYATAILGIVCLLLIGDAAIKNRKQISRWFDTHVHHRYRDRSDSSLVREYTGTQR